VVSKRRKLLSVISKKRVLSLAFISVVLASLLLGGLFVKITRANPTWLFISIISPENTTYSINEIPLIFEYGKENPQLAGTVSWIGYSLDNKEPTTVTSNTTLSGLTLGSHSIIVYANDSFGTMEHSATVNFTVISQSTLSPWPSPSPIPVEEVIQNPASFINQTITVEGFLQIQPMPAPFEFGLASDNQTGIVHIGGENALFVNWSYMEGYDTSWAVVHGVIREEAWTNPMVNQTYHYYYIDAQTIDFESTSSPSPTIAPTSTPQKQTGFLGTNLPTEYGYAIVAVLAVAVVAGLSLAYFKKLRKQT
jgi:hypothetical protein